VSVVYRDADIGPIMALDFGVPVTIGGTPGRGIVDENDTVVVTNNGRGEVISGVHTVQVQTSAFPTLANGTAIIVDGVTYSIARKLTESDTAFTKLVLGSV
jgi:hypothetical protein